MREPTFEDGFPVRVELKEDDRDYTYAFAWLHGQIFKLGVDYRDVFTTLGNRTVAFRSTHRRLAAIFKLKFG